MAAGTLYIVSTPIGNLEDITLRAIRTLKETDLVAAEDTRRALVLLKAYGIEKQVVSYHSYSGRAKSEQIIKKLLEGKNVALVSDSGTPGISDPGCSLVASALEAGITVTAVPGATGVIAALVISGKPTHKFVFEGFLSNKSAKRRKQLEELCREERTVVVYESPHRIEKFMEDLNAIAPEREVVTAREITKKFEEVARGTAASHLERFRTNKPRGEFIVVF